MNTLIVIILIVSITPALLQRNFRRQDQFVNQQNCYTPENFVGVCVPLAYCPSVANIYGAADRRAGVQYIRAVHRSCGGRNLNGDPVVCCSNVQSPQSQLQNQPQTQPPFQPQFQPQPQTQPPFQPQIFPQNPTTEVTKNPFLPQTINTQRPLLPPPTTQRTNAPFFPDQSSSTTERVTNTVARDTNPSTISMPTTSPKGRSCFGPYPGPGICISIKECPKLVDELKRNAQNKAFIGYVQQLRKLCDNTGLDICCEVEVNKTSNELTYPKNTGQVPTRALTPEEGCGYSSHLFKKIVGGETSKVGAWPWIALLGYEGVSGLQFRCGGSLITARHVLTAAHCLRSDLYLVRLGEHDLRREDEAKHMDIRIARMERHPNYNPKIGHSDIAMLYLQENVIFSDVISPICLPLTRELRAKSYIKHTPFVAGWGKTQEGGKSAEVLQELQIPIYDNDLCKDRYSRQNRYLAENQFDNAVVCAGILAGGKDTCQGDSGGPLMIPETFKDSSRFYLIGVVAYGIGCARVEVPGVYTSTQHFMDWINERLSDVR